MKAMKGRLKNSIKTCMDLEQMGVRAELHSIPLEDGKKKLSVALCTLKNDKKK